MSEEVRKGSGLDLAIGVWTRRKWLALLAFAVPFSAAGSLVMFLPNIYQSTATVLVDPQVPETLVRPTVTSAVETRLYTMSQEILSRSRLEALIARFNLYSDLRKRVPTEEVIERMRADIKLELKGMKEHRATITFTISYLGSDPKTVALVTNTLASFYIEENLKVREKQATGTAEFLKVLVEETKTRLDEQERRVSEFKRRYLGELPQQMEANIATLERLHMQLRLNSDSRTRAGERRQALLSQFAEADSIVPPTAAGPGGRPEDPEVRLARLKHDLTELRTQFSEKYPDVVRVKAAITALEQQLTEAKSDGKPESRPAAPVTPYALRLKEALSEAEAETRILKGEEKRLREAIAAYQARVENMPRREQEFNEVSRDYESTRALYQSLLKRYEEAQVAESMEQRQKGEQFRVLDPAVPSREPVAHRPKLILMTLMLSLGVAAGAVVLAEQLDTSFHTVDDLRAFTTVPVLVSIPGIVTKTDIKRRRWRVRLAGAAAILGLVLIVGISYFVVSGNEQLVSILVRGRS